MKILWLGCLCLNVAKVDIGSISFSSSSEHDCGRRTNLGPIGMGAIEGCCSNR